VTIDDHEQLPPNRNIRGGEVNVKFPIGSSAKAELVDLLRTSLNATLGFPSPATKSNSGGIDRSRCPAVRREQFCCHERFIRDVEGQRMREVKP